MEDKGIIEGLNRRIKKFTLLDEKLSQFSTVFLMLTIIKAFPAMGRLSLAWSIPLCAVCASEPLYVYWIKDAKGGNKNWQRRIQKFNLFDLVLAHFAFIFALYIAIKVVPALKEVGLEWSIPLFLAFAVKPFYVFWFK